MYLIPLTLIGTVAAALVALAGLIRNPRSPIHWWLAVFIVSACAWITIGNIQVLLPSELVLPAIKITFVASVMVGFSLLYFAKSVTETRHRQINLILDICTVGVLVWLSLTDAVVSSIISVDINSLRPERGWAYPIVLVFILQFIVRGLVIISRALRKSKGRKRAQLKIILTGLTGGTAFAIITNVILPNVTGNTYTSRFAFLAVVIWTVMLMYAVVQYRFLDIRLAIVRTLAYVGALVSVIGLYIGFISIVLSALLPPSEQSNYSFKIYDIFVAALVATTFHPLRIFFDKLTKKIFYRNAYNSQKVFDEISSSLVHLVDPVDLSKATLERLLTAIRPISASVVILSEKESKAPRVITLGNSKGGELELVKLLEKHKAQIVFEDDVSSPKAHISKQMYQSEVALSARLGAEKGVVGYILFGHKVNGGTFTKQDVELVRIVADSLAVAIQNALRFEEIQKFSETLQTKVEDATKELRATNAQLQRLDTAKDEFVSMASHQLRTPLTSVKGYISMVLEGDAGKITATQRQLLSEAFTSSERMVHLINDFLNVSRLQTGKFMLEYRQVDLSKILSQEVESLQTTARMHDLTLHYREPSYFPLLFLDEGKIRQVIMNFIDNAIYYSPEETVINVELSVVDGQAVLEVRDTGIGVPKAEQEHLFGKFFRATNARKQRPDGTGVGLFLAKKVIVAHGGTIVFRSAEGQGSVFGFRLPVKKLSHLPANSTDKLKQ